jgi:hypothetical protein
MKMKELWSWITPGHACWINASLCASMWNERGEMPEACRKCELPRPMLRAIMKELTEKGVPKNSLLDGVLDDLEFATLQLKLLHFS